MEEDTQPVRWEARIIDQQGMVWFGPMPEDRVHDRMDQYVRTVPAQLLDTLTTEVRPVFETFGEWGVDE